LLPLPGEPSKGVVTMPTERKWDRMALPIAFILGFGIYEIMRYQDPGQRAFWNGIFGNFACLMLGLALVVPLLRIMRIERQRRASAPLERTSQGGAQQEVSPTRG
jgi:hypothetical protein